VSAGHELLTQPTRARLVAVLRELGRPATTEELASLLGLHPSGVRLHLERLREADLVRAERVVHGRGRPRHTWLPSGPAADPPDAGTTLSVWLARVLAADRQNVTQAERVGRSAGRELGEARDGVAPDQAVFGVMAALGFQPRDESSESGRQCLALGNCPYRDAVEVNSDVICRLHRGLLRGVLDSVAPDARLSRFVPHDPQTAGCEVEVRYRR
jgi:predicted ArsR family transcriptional regulator